MGKGARNRAERAQAASRAAARDAARDAIGELVLLQTLDDYVELLRRRPELASAEAAQELQEAAQAPGYGPLFARVIVLLDGARGADPAATWTAYREAAVAAEQRGEQLEQFEAETAAAREAGDHARVLELIDQAPPLATEIGYGLAVCEMLQQRGLAFLNLRTADR